MLHSVAVPLIDDFAMFEFGVVCEVFGLDRSYANLPAFDFRVCGIELLGGNFALDLPRGLKRLNDGTVLQGRASQFRPGIVLENDVPYAAEIESGNAHHPGAHMAALAIVDVATKHA